MADAGIFTDKYGDPDFKGLGPAFKTTFIVYLLYLILLKKLKYSTLLVVVLLFYGFANYLNAVVLDYKDCPEEELFLETTTHEKYAEAAIIIFTGLFVLYNHSKK